MDKTLAPQKTSSPPVTECSQSSLSFARHFRRQVSAQFDGGVISSDGGALLLREVDRRINLLPRVAACFEDRRDPQLIEHQVGELVSQRVYALALGYEDLNDHDELRSDPVLALLAGKSDLEGQKRKQERDRGKPLAGKSTLHRLERTTDGVDRYKKIRCDSEAIDRLLVDVFVEAHPEPPEEIILDIDVTDTPCTGSRRGVSFTVTTDTIAICRCTFFAASTCCVPGSGCRIKTRRRAASRSWSGSWRRSGKPGRRCASSCAVIPGFVATS